MYSIFSANKIIILVLYTFKRTVYIALVHRTTECYCCCCFWAIIIIIAVLFICVCCTLRTAIQLLQPSAFRSDYKLEQRKSNNNQPATRVFEIGLSVSQAYRPHRRSVHYILFVSNHSHLDRRAIRHYIIKDTFRRARPMPVKNAEWNEKKKIRTAFNFLISRRLFLNAILAKIHLKVLYFEWLCVCVFARIRIYVPAPAFLFIPFTICLSFGLTFFPWRVNCATIILNEWIAKRQIGINNNGMNSERSFKRHEREKKREGAWGRTSEQ